MSDSKKPIETAKPGRSEQIGGAIDAYDKGRLHTDGRRIPGKQ